MRHYFPLRGLFRGAASAQSPDITVAAGPDRMSQLMAGRSLFGVNDPSMRAKRLVTTNSIVPAIPGDIRSAVEIQRSVAATTGAIMQRSYKLGAAATALLLLAIPGFAVAGPSLPGITNDSTFADSRASSKPVAVNYSLTVPGNTCLFDKIPVSNKPVQMMVAVTTSGDRGVGEVTIQSTPDFLEWVGLDVSSNKSAATIASGFSSTPSTHIMWVDYNQHVDIEVFNTTDEEICNKTSAAVNAHITFIY